MGQQLKEAVNCAEERKFRKYSALTKAYLFHPIAVGTKGVSTGIILRAIGRHLVEATREAQEANWFCQNLAIALQRGNAFSILSVSSKRF